MRHSIRSKTFCQNMPTSRFIDKERLCGGPLDNCNGDSSSPTFKVGGVSIVLILIILYCMKHPFEMEQNKERKSIDLDVLDDAILDNCFDSLSRGLVYFRLMSLPSVKRSISMTTPFSSLPYQGIFSYGLHLPPGLPYLKTVG